MSNNCYLNNLLRHFVSLIAVNLRESPFPAVQVHIYCHIAMQPLLGLIFSWGYSTTMATMTPPPTPPPTTWLKYWLPSTAWIYMLLLTAKSLQADVTTPTFGDV